jgi:Protein of unknown function (DUF1203)
MIRKKEEAGTLPERGAGLADRANISPIPWRHARHERSESAARIAANVSGGQRLRRRISSSPQLTKISDNFPSTHCLTYFRYNYANQMNPFVDLAQCPVEFHLSGVTNEFVGRIRATLIDDQGQAAVRFTSPRGGEPLRDLLRRAEVGEEVILGSYALFKEAGPFREFGPVYISANQDDSKEVANALESDYFGPELVLRAYDARCWIQQAQLVSRNSVREVLHDWLGDPGIQFVDARFPTYGCFACRFQRQPASP